MLSTMGKQFYNFFNVWALKFNYKFNDYNSFCSVRIQIMATAHQQQSLSHLGDQPKIRVVIRKRPINKKQQNKGQADVVEVLNGVDVKVREHKLKVDLTKYIEEHSFKFDSAFGQEVNNQQIYEQCVRPIVQCAFLGAKVTCFAYGQTGSGKTYTMNGDLQNNCPGMYYLGAQDIFALRDQEYKHLSISVSFFEIYCGKLFDLLNNREQLQAREDGKQNVNIIGLSVKNISSISQFMETIAHGSSVRITSQNSTNSDSSRSHAILQISLMNSKKLYGKISFIDLAGCQRGADTLDQNKQTKIDGAQINKSLLALKECIRALDQGKTHTPFRGSKLTMVLKDSFTGFCRTLMIGNVSPGSGSCQNTLNTLRYADRVKELKKDGTKTQLTREEQQARELMLPRSQKNKQIIIKNDDDSDEQIIISPHPSIAIHEKNMNYQPKAQTQAVQPAPQKKLKYIQQKVDDPEQIQESYKKKISHIQISQIPQSKTQNQRKGVMNITQNNHNENHNPRSVAHANIKQISQENNRMRDMRNKSVIGKVDIKGAQKQNQVSKKSVKEPITQRNSFNQNYSVANLHQKYKQLIGESQKLNKPIISNSSQINLFNRYSKKDKQINISQEQNSMYQLSNINNSKLKTEVSEDNNYLTAENREDQIQWEHILKRFRNWNLNKHEIVEMSVLFEELVKAIMKEELQIFQIHKKLLMSEERMLKDSLSLYNEAQKESKNNVEMMEYTQRLNKHVSQRVKCFSNLKYHIELYQYLMREHENCEAKLVKAAEFDDEGICGPGLAGVGSLDNSDIGLWN